jgi:hypothetical protein
MHHLCHASSAYIVVTVTQTRESATAGLQLPMAHVQHCGMRFLLNTTSDANTQWKACRSKAASQSAAIAR